MPRVRSGNWYYQDYLSDPALALCGFAAQGLWMRLLCYCGISDTFGHLLIAGKKVDAVGIAQVTGHQLSEIEMLLRELEEKRVFSRTKGGVIYNRRMVSDAKKTETNRMNGKKGGNPILSKDETISPLDNPTPLTDQESEGLSGSLKPRARIPSPSPSFSTLPEREQHYDLKSQDAAALVGKMKSPQHHPDYSHAIDKIEREIFAPAQIAMQHWRELNDWLQVGASVELDIIPTLSSLIGRARFKDTQWTPKTLGYFSAAVLQAKLMRIAPPPRANGAFNATPMSMTEKAAFRKANPELRDAIWNSTRFQAALLAAGLQHRWKPD